jgi:hypothetical protein
VINVVAIVVTALLLLAARRMTGMVGPAQCFALVK